MSKRKLVGWVVNDEKGLLRYVAAAAEEQVYSTRRELLDDHPLMGPNECRKYRITITVEEA